MSDTIQVIHAVRRQLAWRTCLFLAGISLVVACGDGTSVTGPRSAPNMVTGRVVSSATGVPVVGAEVHFGPATATTDADGSFSFQGVALGLAEVVCLADGFEDFETVVTVRTETTVLDVALTPFDASIPFTISADLRPEAQSAFVWRAGKAVAHARLSVNGAAMVYAPEQGGYGFYQGSLPEAAAPGSPLALEMKANGLTLRATVQLPEAPVLTWPVASTAVSASDSLTVTWTSATDPDGFEIRFFVADGWGYWETFTAPGGARELTLAVSDLGQVSEVTVVVFAVNEGSFTDPVAPDSRVTATNADGSGAGITIGP